MRLARSNVASPGTTALSHRGVYRDIPKNNRRADGCIVFIQTDENITLHIRTKHYDTVALSCPPLNNVAAALTFARQNKSRWNNSTPPSTLSKVEKAAKRFTIERDYHCTKIRLDHPVLPHTTFCTTVRAPRSGSLLLCTFRCEHFSCFEVLLIESNSSSSKRRTDDKPRKWRAVRGPTSLR